MAQQQAIKLKIAGKSYSFTLKHEANEEQSLAEKEELYRLAEREVNAYVTRFEKAKIRRILDTGLPGDGRIAVGDFERFAGP